MNAVVCQDVWKRYGLRQAGYRTLRDGIRGLFSYRRGRSSQQRRDFWALREIALEVPQGEALGVIGANGSGKSTLLKLIAGVTSPTRGRVEVCGRVGALIEVGTGFHPELTGQENVFLYGTILGLPRSEIRRKFDQIVEFAGVGEFLGTPIKRYSSGMRVRLGFAVAAHLDPHLLLVDEVLSVGDVAFQRRCIQYIRQLLDGGTTIIFVSHELPTVERICRRVVWMDGGQIREAGPTVDVVNHYLQNVDQAMVRESQPAVGRSGLVIEQVRLSGSASRVAFVPGDPLTVDLIYRADQEPIHAVVALKIVDDRLSTLIVSRPPGDDGMLLQGAGVLRCAFPSLPLASRTYEVWAQVLRLPDYHEEIPWQAVGTFSVTGARYVHAAHPLDVHEWESPVLEVAAQWSNLTPDRAKAGHG